MSENELCGLVFPPVARRLLTENIIRFPRRLGATLVMIAAATSTGLCVSAAQAQGESSVSEDHPTEEVVITEKARAHFRAGVNLLQDPGGARYEDAYQQFKAAYAESPSWKILSNLGLAAMMLEKDGEAIDAFEKSLAEGGDQLSEAEREQTQRDLETLKASAVTVTITTASQGVKIKDERVTNRGDRILNQYEVPADGALVIRVRPGNHKITAQLAEHEDLTWEFMATAASGEEHTFDFQKVKTGASDFGVEDAGANRPVPLSVWIGAGVTGAFTAGAVATGVVALSKNSKYDTANSAGDPSAESLRSDVKTMNLVTDLLIGGAVAAGVVTTVLYFTRPSVPLESTLRIEPRLGRDFAALSISGNF